MKDTIMEIMEKIKTVFRRWFVHGDVQQVRNGKWKEFNKHAVLVSEGIYRENLKHGLWKQYYESGELLIEETYEDGILHGRYASFHQSGCKLSEGVYQHGKREGFFNVYDEDGRQTKKFLFVNNVLLEETDLQKTKPARVKVAV